MELNWSQCTICQEEISEPLKCPLESHDPSGKIDAYTSFLANVEQFGEMGVLPTSICFGSDITAADFETHSASWHKSCRLKYNNSKLARAKKRVISQVQDSERSRPMKRQALNISNCLFCEKGDADAYIRSMITELQDIQFLARIEGGDLIAKDAKYHLKCLVSLRNRYRSCIRRSLLEPDRTSEKLNESRVFVVLTSYIEKAVYSGTLLFKLSEIHEL